MTNNECLWKPVNKFADRDALTLPQQRTNYEIDAARKSIAGMTPQEIAHRTAKATNTGRENPDYDPNLARQARIAATRKIGDDGEFDGAGDAPSRFTAVPEQVAQDIAQKTVEVSRPTTEDVTSGANPSAAETLPDSIGAPEALVEDAAMRQATQEQGIS